MKSQLLFLIFAGVGIVSCSKNSIVEPPTNTDSQPVVSFAAGNQYYIHYVNAQGIMLVDWYQWLSILRDTTIQGNKFYVFSTGEILRSTNIAVTRWTGSLESVWYPFNVKTGDTAWVAGYKTLISDVYTDSIFSEPQKIVEVTNAGFTADTVFRGRYCTKFGLLFTQKSFSSQSWQTGLAGAKMDSIFYGYL